MAYKYIANQPLDCIVGGIPITFRQGDIIPQGFVPHMVAHHRREVVECDVNGIIITSQSPPPEPPALVVPVEEPVTPPSAPIADANPVADVVVPDTPVTSAPDASIDIPEKVVLPYKSQAEMWSLYKHDLVDWCSKLGLDTSGSKGNLIARIAEACKLPEK